MDGDMCDIYGVFPASAGMIPWLRSRSCGSGCVPRIRGDDPKGHLMDALRFTIMRGDDQKMHKALISEMASRDCACTRHDSIPEDLIDGYPPRHA